MITITLNGESRQIDHEIPLDELIDRFLLPRKQIAVELNREVVRRANWPMITIGDGDRLEVVHLVGGG